MKIFVSWSGNLSNKIAETIKKWLPCLINSVDVFFSSEDIEKGENWDSKISGELSDCKYGIICLTKENVSAPWINFEAGAIAKTLDSKVATLMINVNPSDVKGPLSRYQGTKIEREDFYQLIQDINKQCDLPITDSVLENTFNALWDKIHEEFESCISLYTDKTNTKTKKEDNSSEAIEEILQLLRKQNTILLSPQEILPIDYFEYILKHINHSEKYTYDVYMEILGYLSWLISRMEEDKSIADLCIKLNVGDLIDIIAQGVNKVKNREMYNRCRKLRVKYLEMRNFVTGDYEFNEDDVK